MVNRLLSKMLVFLIIDFNILSHVKKKFFQENTIFKGIIFFENLTCYNSSLVLSRVGPALVKAAYNIACPQLNGNTLISLYAVLLRLERLWTLLPRFPADAKATHAQDTSSVIATNKLKSKVLKNNTMNGKNLTIIWWMVKEGQKNVSTYRAQRKAFPINKKGVQEIDLSQFSLKNYYKVNSRRNMFFTKIEKIAL